MGLNKKKNNLTHFKLRYYYLLFNIVVIVVIIIVVVIVIDVVCCVAVIVVIVVVIIIVVVFLLLLFTVCYDSNYIKGENGKHNNYSYSYRDCCECFPPLNCVDPFSYNMSARGEE